MNPLYEHQLEGANTLAIRGKMILGDVPGLGKTRTLLQALAFAGSHRPLVVCPAIVRTHWQREAAVLAMDPPIVKSYDEITRGGVSLMKELLGAATGVDALVMDESHYLKHATAKRTKILLGRDGYARRLPVVFPATGTPIPKHPGEIWTTLSALFPEVLIAHDIKTYSAFMNRFCVTTHRMIRGHMVEKVVGVRNTGELAEILDTVMLRRTLGDVGLDVPRLIWQQITVDAVEDMVHTTAHDEAAVRAAIAAGDLASIASDPQVARMRRRLGELKVKPVVEIVREHLDNSDDKIVLFAHHRSVLGQLLFALAEYGVAYVDGDVSDANRREAIDRFQTDPTCRVFLGQNIACQTGITLTAASRVIMVEPDWTAVVNEQLGHRVARIGQVSQHCVAQMVALAGTLDEAIVGQHYREVRMASAVLNAARAA